MSAATTSTKLECLWLAVQSTAHQFGGAYGVSTAQIVERAHTFYEFVAPPRMVTARPSPAADLVTVLTAPVRRRQSPESG